MRALALTELAVQYANESYCYGERYGNVMYVNIYADMHIHTSTFI